MMKKLVKFLIFILLVNSIFINNYYCASRSEQNLQNVYEFGDFYGDYTNKFNEMYKDVINKFYKNMTKVQIEKFDRAINDYVDDFFEELKPAQEKYLKQMQMITHLEISNHFVIDYSYLNRDFYVDSLNLKLIS